MKKQLLAFLLITAICLTSCGQNGSKGRFLDRSTMSGDYDYESESEELSIKELYNSIPTDLEQKKYELSEEIYGIDPGYEDLTLSEDGETIYINNQIIIVTEDNVKESEVKTLATKYDAEIVGKTEIVDKYQLLLSNHKDINELNEIIERIKKEKIILDAFSDEIVFDNVDTEFNDPWDIEEGELNIDNPEKAPVSDGNWGIYAIHAPEAWEYLDRMRPVNVGIIEKAFDIDTQHEDLPKNHIYYANELQDFWIKHVLKANEKSHSENVAGIICAKPDNRLGITGVDAIPNTKLYVACTITIMSRNKTMNVICDMVANKNVKVINISMYDGSRGKAKLATEGDSKSIKIIQDRADNAATQLKKLLKHKKEFVIVISAGNDNDNGVAAKYNHYITCIDDEELVKRIIVVGNVGLVENGEHEKKTNSKRKDMPIEQIGNGYYYRFDSCRGDRVDILAPGCDILSCSANNKYYYCTGTSQAAPHVAGVAAMVFGCNPKLSGDKVKEIIVNTSDKIYDVEGNIGMLRADKAVEYALGIVHKSGNLWRLMNCSYKDMKDEFHDFPYGADEYGNWTASKEIYDEVGKSQYYISASFYEDFTPGDENAYAYSVEIARMNDKLKLELFGGAYTGMKYDEIKKLFPQIGQYVYDEDRHMYYANLFLDGMPGMVEFYFDRQTDECERGKISFAVDY